MKEIELRKELAETAKEYLGTVSGGDKHAEIVSIYNSIRPLPVGYALKMSDDWCAAFVSAMAAKLKLTDIIPAECSCPRQIKLWQSMGRWEENDAFVPDIGDYIYYDWQDGGSGDNKGNPDHVGIVVSVSGKSISVIEGNVSRSVKYRNITANAKYIRGYGLPNFASRSDEEDSMRYKTLNDIPEGAYREAVSEFVKLGVIKGKTDGTLDLSEDVIRALIFGKRYIDLKIAELKE